jgi:hypothetical protein
MTIGLIDVDSHHFPNYALMKISAYHKDKGDMVEWYTPFTEHYDIVYIAKIFTFTLDYMQIISNADKIIRGGTGYDIKSKLPDEIDQFSALDYTIYPRYNFSVQFLSRGCIRHCPFCLVHDKEGYIKPVKPLNLNESGQWIEVLDNNFFANPDWESSVEYLNSTGQKVNLHGVDIRIMDERQCEALASMRLKRDVHIAWDLPALDLEPKIAGFVKHFPAYKVRCYILIGFNSTREQDVYRIETCRKYGILPFVMVYRDYDNMRMPTQYERDLAQYVNKPWIFKSCKFEDFSPRKGFKCKEYLNEISKSN